MNCIQCGKPIQEGNSFCTHCGKPVQSQAQPQRKSSKSLWLKTLIIVAAVLLSVTMIIGVFPLLTSNENSVSSETPTAEKASSAPAKPTPPPTPTLSRFELQECLSKTWSRAERVGGYTINYELTFSNGLVSCMYQYLQKSYSIIGFDYDIISGNQIQGYHIHKDYTITFNEEKNVMTVSPAISSKEKSENWYLNPSLETEDEKTPLSDALLNNWTRAGFSNGYYYTYELDFSKDGAYYHYSDDTNDSSRSSNLDYKIISHNQIKFTDSNIIYTLSFDDKKESMTISPAFSGTAESETWYLKSLRLTDDIQHILWQRFEVSNGSSAVYDLYFDDTRVECHVMQGNQNNSFRFDYEIISNTQIRNKESGAIHTITLNKAKNIIIISPAITSTAESETFCYHNG